MYRFTRLLGASSVCMFVLPVMFAANAADTSRAAVSSTGRAGIAAIQEARMPTMAVLPTNATGNMAADVQHQAQPEPQPQPEPVPECADGGVRNSEYTVSNCMNDVLSCINNGALAGGLNDLFNEDMRNAIVNGMGLCSVQVEKCMVEVRRDCKPVYRAIADVWVDFNSRKIQPEYYNFVLRKTGLTPNQAENTCMLLDKNTYGPSFAAVANDGTTTAEYNNQVGAYNGQMGNVLIKSNPQGVTVNDGNPGVDGSRGHYARWDATTATCYLRVGAYNKDQQIKNSWLFGALGDDKVAEVWRAAGETFTCNKDLFGFSLMNDTSTAAVVGVGGGTLLGAGIGAVAGHGNRSFDCNNASALKELNKEIEKNNSAVIILNRYVPTKITGSVLNESQCRDVVDLYVKYRTVKDDGACFGRGMFECTVSDESEITDSDIGELCADYESAGDCENALKEMYSLSVARCTKKIVGCDYKSLKDPNSFGGSLKCTNVDGGCAPKSQILAEIAELDPVFKNLDVLNGEKSNMLGSIATGAAIGAGTGGVATAITAFVERNNINCRVGDGLNTVAFGKSHSIDTLKDFYVKWNLRVPDTVSPTSTAVDCKSWKLACAQYTDLEQCKSVALNYKPDVNGTITLVRSACDVSGSVCIENAPVAASYGACTE